MIDRKQERILCAAYRFKKGYRTPNCEEYFQRTGEELEAVYKEPWREVFRMATGWRHADILYKWGKEAIDQDDCGGFMTSKGRYVDRTEAAKIAVAAGQCEPNKTYLYSEDLY